MSRIEEAFRGLRGKGEAALIGYITAGVPSPDETVEVAEAVIRGGVDILELGLPFSDPIADGPTIQVASHRALQAGTTPAKVFKIVEEVKARRSLPVALLTYYNPVYRMGVDLFLESACSLGVDGLIIPDLPVEEADEYRRSAKRWGIDTIFLASPSTSRERLERIVEATSGFLYLVSLYGVTGARPQLQESTVGLVERFREHIAGRANLAVGFGISRPEHVRELLSHGADGVIVGSAFMKVVNEAAGTGEMLKELEALAGALKAAAKPMPRSSPL